MSDYPVSDNLLSAFVTPINLDLYISIYIYIHVSLELFPSRTLAGRLEVSKVRTVFASHK